MIWPIAFNVEMIFLSDVDNILNSYCQTERCRNLIINNCYFSASTDRRPLCGELTTCVQSHINYYRNSGQRDPANKSGPVLHQQWSVCALLIIVSLALIWLTYVSLFSQPFLSTFFLLRGTPCGKNKVWGTL